MLVRIRYFGDIPFPDFFFVTLGLLAALFWSLFANGIVATQVVEDGTLSSLIVSDDVPAIAVALLKSEIALQYFQSTILRCHDLYFLGRRPPDHQCVRPK